MKVLIPSALRSYTESGWAEANGATLTDVLADLDRRYPGIRFRMIDEQNRIRPHIRFFIGGVQARDLAQALDPNDELLIVQALSGG
ncbi:MAG: MoaD/ThiS family protein [Sulfuritalea sp.]|nr:MoaD/ThiS family protein [Sulfuritalea sp.]